MLSYLTANMPQYTAHQMFFATDTATMKRHNSPKGSTEHKGKEETDQHDRRHRTGSLMIEMKGKNNHEDL